MDFITRQIDGFKAGVVIVFGPVCGIVFGTPAFVHAVWFASVLKIGVVVLSTGLAGMFTAWCKDIYDVRYKERTRNFWKPKNIKDGRQQKGDGEKAA